MAKSAQSKANAKARKAEREAVKAAELEARSAALQANFDAACKDPNHELKLYDDPIWNPHHPLHVAVNALINGGLSATEAERQVRDIGAEKIEAEAKEAADGLEDLVAWLAEQSWSEFAVSLASQYRTKGFLSPKQQAAGYSMMQKVQAKRQAKEETPEVKGLDLSALPSGYYAVPGGDTRLKVRVAHGKPGTKWDGWTFVSDGAEYGSRTNYGSQRPGQNYRGQIVEQLTAIVADPKEAMTAYGKLWGVCGSCGRMLEDETSIAAGIGPICAAKW